MSNSIFLIGLACMTAITFVLRAAPTLLPRVLLDSPWLKALNFALPLAVMTILILAALPLDAAWQTPDGRLELIAQLPALGLVLWVYIKRRNVLLAMVVGVAALNAFLWLLHRL